MTRSPFLLVCVFCLLASALAGRSAASTAQGEVEAAQEPTFSAAKRYVLNQFAKPSEAPSKVVHLEDASAGLLRFTYRDDSFSDDGATIEVIDLEGSRSKVKVTIPDDFSGRSELLLQKLRQAALEAVEADPHTLPYDAKRVYRSALRYILKTFVSPKQKKEDVIRMASEDVGLIRFVYRNGAFKDPGAGLEVISAGASASRIRVSLPADPTGRQVLLESDILAAVRSDLGGERPSEEPAE